MADSQLTSSKWRERALGAMISLGVTVLGGVAVYYATRSPTIAPQREELLYVLDPITRFATGSTHLAFTTLKVSNSGALAARNVHIVLNVDSGMAIRDEKVSISSGAAATFTVVEKSSLKYGLMVPVLATGEVASVALIFGGAGRGEPTVSVKSDASVGRRDSQISTTVSPKGTLPFSKAIPFFAAFLVGAQLFLFFGIRRGRLSRSAYASSNNAGFVLLHSGLLDRSVAVLEESIRTRGADDSHPLANLALASELTGNSDTADRLILAAQFYASTRHEKAVIDFNRAFIAMNRNDSISASTFMVSACELSRKEVRRYLCLSTLAKEFSTNAKLASIIDTARQ